MPRVRFIRSSAKTACGLSATAARWAAVAMLLGIQCGCRVGPDAVPPTPRPLAATFQQGAGKNTSETDRLTHWWTTFNDPHLNALIEEANSQNLSLAQAYWRVREARARLGVARGDWFPQANGSASSTYRLSSQNALQSPIPNNDGYGYYLMGFDTAWEIDLFGRIARSVEASNAELHAEREAFHDVQVTLLADVATTYLDIRQLQQRLLISQRNLDLQQKTLHIVRTRQEAGVVGQLDEAEAESNVHLTASSIPPIQFELQNALNRLAVLLGRSPDVNLTLQAGFGILPTPESEVLRTGVPAQLLQRRPDIRAAEARVIAANARVGVAIADRLPQLTIRGDISVEARHLDVLYSGASLAHTLGPGFRWNVLNFGKLRSQIEARKAAHQQSLVAYQAAVLTATLEVESALFEYDRHQLRAKMLEQAVAATQRASDISQIRYEQNLVPFLRVLDAQRNLASAEGNLAATRGEALVSLVKLYKALGGGWENVDDGCRPAPLPPPAAEEIVLPIEPRPERLPAIDPSAETEQPAQDIPLVPQRLPLPEADQQQTTDQ